MDFNEFRTKLMGWTKTAGKKAGAAARFAGEKAGAAAKTAGEKAGLAVEIGKLKFKVATEEGSITGLQESLGQLVWEKYLAGAAFEDDMTEICVGISEHNQQLSELNAQIDALKAELKKHGGECCEEECAPVEESAELNVEEITTPVEAAEEAPAEAPAEPQESTDAE